MASNFRTFIRKTLIVINFLLAFLFLLACLAPYLDPVKWWFISWLGFIFPFLLFFLFASVVLWVFLRPKFAVLFLVVLLIGWKSISVFFSFHFPHEFKNEKQPNALRIVSWNVARFVEIMKNN